MITELQKQTAQAIVNIFETGSARGEYGQVTVLHGDSGHLTYGRAQTTIASGNLYLLIKAYVAEPQACFGAELKPHLPALEVRDFGLDFNLELHRKLRDAGEDPIMQMVQDDFFDRVYWEPAVRSATNAKVATPLGVAVVYDSRIHGSWLRMRNLTNDQISQSNATKERKWIEKYVEVRRNWLANHRNRLLRRTVYRMDSFKTMITDDSWDLPLPLKVRGVIIDEAAISDTPPLRVSADDTFTRMLRFKKPLMRGEDVEDLQQLLARAGIETAIDGVYGRATKKSVKSFQQQHGLISDGIVGPATWSALIAEQ